MCSAVQCSAVHAAISASAVIIILKTGLCGLFMILPAACACRFCCSVKWTANEASEGYSKETAATVSRLCNNFVQFNL